MSTAENVAEQSAQLCVGALGLALGAVSPAAGLLAPLAVLGVVGKQWLDRKRLACQRTTLRGAVEALAASRDFRAADLTRAAAILAHDAPAQPPALSAEQIRALADPDADRFAHNVASALLGAIRFQPDDGGARAAIHVALVTTARGFLADRAFRDSINDVLITQIARDAGLLRDAVDRVDARARDMQAEMGAQAAMLSTLMAQIGPSQEAQRLRGAGVTEDAIVALARQSLGRTADLNQAWGELRRLLEVAVRVQEEGRAGSNHGGFVDAVLARVAELSRGGAYADAGDEIEAALAREEAESRARRLRLLRSAAEVALLEGDARRAADRLVQIADVEAGGRADRPALAALFLEQHGAGRDGGRPLDLMVATEVARVVLRRAEGPEAAAAGAVNLAAALTDLGGLTGAPDRLREAVAVAEAGLRALADGDHRHRAWLKGITGDALVALSEHEPPDGPALDAAILHLREAVALASSAPEAAGRLGPLHLGLGNALTRRGVRLPEEAIVAEAEAHYLAALDHMPHADHPVNWGRVRYALGNIAFDRGRRRSDPGLLRRALDEYDMALEELRREVLPLEWATANAAIGHVRFTLAAFGEAGCTYADAARALDRALSEHTRDRAPVQWAMSHGVRALCHGLIAQDGGDRALAARAAQDLADAAEVLRLHDQATRAAAFEAQLPAMRELAAADPDRPAAPTAAARDLSPPARPS